MVVLGCYCRENHHEGGCRCLETHTAAGGEEENKAATAAGCREGGRRSAATVTAHLWRKNMWLVVVCRSGGMREGKRRGEGKGRRVLSEGRSTHNPNPSFYIIYTFIYLFIFLGSSSCEAQLRNSPS